MRNLVDYSPWGRKESATTLFSQRVGHNGHISTLKNLIHSESNTEIFPPASHIKPTKKKEQASKKLYPR